MKHVLLRVFRKRVIAHAARDAGESTNRTTASISAD
jgi:hypothetical protein